MQQFKYHLVLICKGQGNPEHMRADFRCGLIDEDMLTTLLWAYLVYEREVEAMLDRAEAIHEMRAAFAPY
jgi:hypothetical protein